MIDMKERKERVDSTRSLKKWGGKSFRVEEETLERGNTH